MRGTSLRYRAEYTGMPDRLGMVESDREEDRFAASNDQGVFIMSCQGVIRGANSPTVAIDSNAAGVGGNDGLDGDDEPSVRTWRAKGSAKLGTDGDS
jgi:hypothetical protein